MLGKGAFHRGCKWGRVFPTTIPAILPARSYGVRSLLLGLAMADQSGRPGQQRQPHGAQSTARARWSAPEFVIALAKLARLDDGGLVVPVPGRFQNRSIGYGNWGRGRSYVDQFPRRSEPVAQGVRYGFIIGVINPSGRRLSSSSDIATTPSWGPRWAGPLIQPAFLPMLNPNKRPWSQG